MFVTAHISIFWLNTSLWKPRVSSLPINHLHRHFSFVLPLCHSPSLSLSHSSDICLYCKYLLCVFLCKVLVYITAAGLWVEREGDYQHDWFVLFSSSGGLLFMSKAKIARTHKLSSEMQRVKETEGSPFLIYFYVRLLWSALKTWASKLLNPDAKHWHLGLFFCSVILITGYSARMSYFNKCRGNRNPRYGNTKSYGSVSASNSNDRQIRGPCGWIQLL